MTDKVRENKLRRMAERQGYTLVKSRARDPKALTYGKFAIKDAKGDLVPNACDKTADEVEWILEQGVRNVAPGLRVVTPEDR